MTEEILESEFVANLSVWRDFHERLHLLLEDILNSSEISFQIKSRIKSLESIKAKAQRKNLRSVTEFFDIVGLQLIVRTKEDVVAVGQLIESQLSIYEACYYNFDKNYLEKVRGNSLPDSNIYNYFQKADPSEAAFYIVSVDDSRAQLPEWHRHSKQKAEIQIKTVFGDAFSDAMHAINYKEDEKEKINIAALNVSSRLSFAVAKFQELIEKPEVHEKKDIHPYIEEHNFILHPNPDELFSEVSIGLGTEYRIDFLVRETNGSYLLIEIENPRHRLFTKSGEFTSHVNHAIRQVEDWQQWIEENLSVVQKRYPDIISPAGLVVIGRSSELSPEERKKLERRNINFRGRMEVLTYDQLIDNANSFITAINKNLCT